ncbi:MAG: hypothetical protein Q7J35_17360 [Candidatus Methanoperedens sp.]|nr:hypothetical protein [Candidatus Methanoperedens sp.]
MDAAQRRAQGGLGFGDRRAQSKFSMSTTAKNTKRKDGLTYFITYVILKFGAALRIARLDRKT